MRKPGDHGGLADGIAPAPIVELGASENLNRTRYYRVTGRRGLVVAGHPLAAGVGARVLATGGNAVDAALAASAALAVVRPQMCGLGGDLLMLVYQARERRVHAINGNGAAPSRATVERFFGSIPTKGPQAATVPGLAGAWEAASEAFGTQPIGTLIEDAVDYAANGFPVYARLRHWIEWDLPVYRRFQHSKELFLPDGAAPCEGRLFLQPQLARSLELIRRGGVRDFYEGELARLLASTIQADGGLISPADLKDHRTAVTKPLSCSYREWRVFETPPTSQGYMVLEGLNVLSALLGPEAATADVVHAMVETKKLLFEERLQLFGDPDFVEVPLGLLLSIEHAAELAAQIGTVARKTVGEASPSETAVLLTVDSQRNGVAAIQSNFYDSGYVAGETGILLNGRLQGFSLDPCSPNVLQPGKKPISTLNVWMITDREGELRYLGGSPGGYGQIQTNLQVLHLLLDRGLAPQEAVEAPRWVHGDLRSEGSGKQLALEARFDERVLHELVARGHEVCLLPDWAEMATGSAKVIAVRGDVLEAGVDPRRDAYAVAS